MPRDARIVLRGLYDIRDRTREPVMAAEIAEHMRLDEQDVLAELRELKNQRLVRDRRRRGVRVWEPW
jgi:Mn-dependent DtxR family transcriptional regulator